MADVADGSFTVDVKVDEEINRRPVVYFVSLTAKADGSDFTYKIDHVDPATSLTGQETDDHWREEVQGVEP